jgi:hypothetical protein
MQAIQITPSIPPTLATLSSKLDSFTKRAINMVNDIRIHSVPVVAAEAAGVVVIAHHLVEATLFVPV